MERNRNSQQNNGYVRRDVRPFQSVNSSNGQQQNIASHNQPSSSITPEPKHPKKVPKKKKLFKKRQKLSKVRKMIINDKGVFMWRPPKFIQKIMFFCQRHRVFTRFFTIIVVLVMTLFILFTTFEEHFKSLQYKVSPKAEALIIDKNPLLSTKLNFDNSSNSFNYNKDYNPVSGDVAGQTYGPKFSATFMANPSEGVELIDPTYNVALKVKPKFKMKQPVKDDNRLVYPLAGKNGAKVVSLRSIGFKEDIILEQYYKDSLDFEYELEMPESLEARLEGDGSLAIYGPENSTLLGKVSTGNEKDAQLLSDARKNSNKNKLIFRMPPPYIKESGNKNIISTAKFLLEGKKLTLRAEKLKELNYPISIDPTVYVETAAKLMRGNNETNTDFDIDDELIQKSQTTGARIDAWQGNLDMNDGIWDQSTAAAGGYVYRSGGRTGLSKPQIVDQQETALATDNTSFQMTMPTTRPAGDLYVALMCHDGTGAITPPSGWTEYADTREHAAYYKIGTDSGGGNESANYTWTGGSEKWFGVIVRVTGFDSADPVSGTAGTGSNASNAVPIFPTTTPDSSATLVIRSAGVDEDVPSDTAWVPSGHTKISSGNSGGTNDCGFAAASLDTPPATGVASGTTTLGDTTLFDSYGASSIAINPDGTTPAPEVQDIQGTSDGSDGSSFQMTMPTSRPAGDLYIAMMCHDGDVRVNPPGGGGWTELADLREFAAYYKVGTDVSGGNEAANYTWNLASGTETFAGAIVRVTGFDSADPIAGTVGTASSASNATPTYPAVTPDENKTLIIRSNGIDDDVPTATGWLPANHTKLDSRTSAGTNDCGFTAASLNNSPAAGIATAAVNLGEMSDTYGAFSVAINAATTTAPESAVSSLEWAKFNSDTLEIESPNPGEGACDGWCTETTYNLPSARRGHTMITYNGYIYVLGGVDGSGNRVSTVYIAKIGANGEPQLWHPTDTDPDNWDYWYEDTGLSSSTARSYFSAAAYNNRLYLLGGQTDASTGGTNTAEYAEIRPNGTLGTWTSGTALPSARHGHTMHVYNDTIYLIGGNSSGTLQNAVAYSKLNANGTMNSWVTTSSFSTGRSTWGGSYTTVWGAYIYLSGGCTAVNGSGYCTTVGSDTQIASINADGSISAWGSINNLTNTRFGYTLIGWQNGLYRIGGCTEQDSSNGKCLSTLADVDYGVINPAGEVSTVNISSGNGSGTCTGGSPTNCSLPGDDSDTDCDPDACPGDGAGEIGHMLNASTILNGYLYVFGGCTEYNCNSGTNTPTSENVSSNTAFVSINSDGSLSKPSTCSGTSYGSWCVDSTNTINGADGIAASGVTVFNNRIYLVGGFDSTGGMTGEIYYNTTNTNGSLGGAWTAVDLTTAGVAEDISYTFAYARANPLFAGSNPGNLFIFGGCGTMGTGPSCSNDYETEVYKCNITTTGSVSGCSTSSQLQIDSTPGTGGTDGLGLHSGTVYANYVYLIGGFSAAEADKDDVLYAEINNSNNIVAVSGSDWTESPNKLNVGRRRGFSFGYNGHIYSLGGFDATTSQVIPFIEWSKMNVSDGSVDPFITSSIQINQRWGLSVVVSNSYAYVIGGCDVGYSPNSCSSFEPAIQTFQLYNNDSGAINDYTAQSDQDYATSTDRIGASAAVHDGYLYVAGGCTDISCSTVTDNTQFAQLSSSDGTVGTWNNTTDSTMPGQRAFGQLEVAGDTNTTLYYIGGIDSTGDEKNDIYYGTLLSGNVSSWTAASSTLPGDRAYSGGTVWDNRIYIVGGIDDSAAVSSVVYVSPKMSSGGNMSGTWSSSTAFNVARQGPAVTAYANNLYLFGGFDGSNYLSDSQFASLGYKTGTISQSGSTVTGSGTTFASTMVGSTIQYPDGSKATVTAFGSTTSITVDVSKTVNSGTIYTIQDGSVGSWSYSNSLPGPIRDADAVSANGYIYLVGGRSASTTCLPNTLITPISANTTIATGNNPTGTGEWYETNTRYTGDRYGAALAYSNGKMYLMGGGCSSVLSTNKHYYSTVKSQPQVAIYSRMIDTDSDVFPNSWLMNGVDNSIGARWQVKYRSMNDIDGVPTDCGSADMSTWGQETDYGDVTLGDVATYTPKDGSGTDIDCARYYYFYVSIDASKTFGYPEDTARGPTITDLSLFFTSDPSKRLRHGKTFTGGEKQPLDTPCRQSNDAQCPLP